MIAPFRTFMHLAGDAERLPRPDAPRRRCSAEGGQFVFDVFEPSAADIRATHDRWIARREGISERPLWDAAERRLELDVRLPGRVVAMTLEWRSAAEWRALCAEAGLTVLAADAGFDGDAAGRPAGRPGLRLRTRLAQLGIAPDRAAHVSGAARRAPARLRSPRSATRRRRRAGCARRRSAPRSTSAGRPVRSPPSANATGARRRELGERALAAGVQRDHGQRAAPRAA